LPTSSAASALAALPRAHRIPPPPSRRALPAKRRRTTTTRANHTTFRILMDALERANIAEPPALGGLCARRS
jgi:hypothetical protein